ncbi:MAG TPA: DNA polymerase III subunit beta [Thermotogota bacterium]|nr:DNA polymerase III subunit beta [Thermotogota bacterium]
MRISIEKQKLISAMQHITAVTPGKTIKPILAGVLIQAEGTIRLSATDMTVSIQCEIDGEVADRGATVLNAKMLLEIAKTSPVDTIIIKADDGVGATVQCGAGIITMETMPAEEYPSLLLESSNLSLSLVTFMLHDAMKSVFYAASTDEMMRNMNGLFFDRDENITRIVAADGFRLSVANTNGITTHHDPFVLPFKCSKALLDVLKASGGGVELKLGPSMLFVSSDGIRLGLRLSDLDYPNYRRITEPANAAKTTVSIPKEELVKALRFARVVTAAAKESVRMKIENESITLIARAAGTGDMSITADCVTDGPGLDIAFNPDFLLEALEHYPGDVAQICFTTCDAVFCLKGEGIYHYIMPVRMPT